MSVGECGSGEMSACSFAMWYWSMLSSHAFLCASIPLRALRRASGVYSRTLALRRLGQLCTARFGRGG